MGAKDVLKRGIAKMFTGLWPNFRAQKQVEDVMRTVRFQPYRKGMGPRFTLQLIWLGSDKIGYRLKQGKKVLFEGNDFRPSRMHSVDGDEAVKAIMSFLTLRPGDTDREYFDDYTPEQMEYCQQHAEALSCEVYRRFGE